MKKLSYLIVALLSLTSCITSKERKEQLVAAIPPAFYDSSSILILEGRTSGLNHNGMNNHLVKAFRKYYTGKFELVAWDQIEKDPKYQDKKVYRFVLGDDVSNTLGTSLPTSSTSGFGSTGSYRISYALKDRLENKDYPVLASSNIPADAMEGSAKKLNKALHRQ